MYQYTSLLLILWLTSASKVSGEKVDRLSPLMLSYHQKEYRFPKQVRITTDGNQEFYNEEAEERFFCPNEYNVDTKVEHAADTRITLRDRDCLVEKEFEENGQKLCKSEVKPVIIKSDPKEDKRCGTTGFEYKVIYEICLKSFKDDIEKLEEDYYTVTYQVCFDHQQNRVLFTRHFIRTPEIFRQANLTEEMALRQFPRQYSTETYGIEKFENLKNIVNAYEKQDSEDTNKQVLHQLVPTEDFALYHWMKTTYFHIINYGLIHKSKAPIWDAINAYVKSWIIKFEKALDEPEGLVIYTGTSGEQYVGENKDELLYLGNDQSSGIIIPKVWWKLLHSVLDNKAVVIIMHNDNDSKEMCKKEEKACEPTKWKTDQLNEEDFENVYCCSYLAAAEFIPDLWDLPIAFNCNVLKLD